MQNENKFTIKIMELDDVQQAHYIEKRCFSDAWSPKLLYNELENNLAYYAVIMYGDEIAGYIGVWFILDDTQIMTVAVDPDYQGMGLGNMLMEHIHQVSNEKNMYTMSLEVRVSNKKAINLYKKFGFEIVYIRKQYYSDNKEDAYIMYKYLR